MSCIPSQSNSKIYSPLLLILLTPITGRPKSQNMLNSTALTRNKHVSGKISSSVISTMFRILTTARNPSHAHHWPSTVPEDGRPAQQSIRAAPRLQLHLLHSLCLRLHLLQSTLAARSLQRVHLEVRTDACNYAY